MVVWPVIPARDKRIMGFRPVWAKSKKKKVTVTLSQRTIQVWLQPIILATWEAYVGGSQSKASPSIKVLGPYLEKK
jgi:hypothetical protein